LGNIVFGEVLTFIFGELGDWGEVDYFSILEMLKCWEFGGF